MYYLTEEAQEMISAERGIQTMEAYELADAIVSDPVFNWEEVDLIGSILEESLTAFFEIAGIYVVSSDGKSREWKLKVDMTPEWAKDYILNIQPKMVDRGDYYEAKYNYRDIQTRFVTMSLNDLLNPKRDWFGEFMAVLSKPFWGDF